MSGTKMLRTGAILEIVLGAVWFIVIQFILNSNMTVAGLDEEALTSAFLGLTGLYAIHGFQVIAGIIGLVRCGHRSLVTVILGAILFFAQLWHFVQVGTGDVMLMVGSIVALIIPGLYFLGALKNHKGE